MVTMCIQQSALVDAWFAERAHVARAEDMQLWAKQFTDLSRRMFEPAEERMHRKAPRKRGNRS
jgi:hypothetical protein